MPILLWIAALNILGIGLIGEVSANSLTSMGKALSTTEPECRFGVFPHLTPRRLEAAYGPVSNAISKILGRDCRFSTKPSFGAFSKELEKQAYDIALIQSFDYAAAFGEGRYLPLAISKDEVKALFVVRPDSGLHRLEDLRGKAIGLPPARALVSELALPLLARANIDVEAGGSLRHFRNHDSCLHALLIGTVSSCVTAPVPLRSFESRIRNQLQVVAASTAKPGALFVVRAGMPPQERERLLQEILRWSVGDEGRGNLNRMGRVEGFVPIEEASRALRDDLQRSMTLDQGRLCR